MPITKEVINRVINVLQFVIVVLLTFSCIAFLIININTSNNVKKLSDENTTLERRIMTLESLIMASAINAPPPREISHEPAKPELKEIEAEQ